MFCRLLYATSYDTRSKATCSPSQRYPRQAQSRPRCSLNRQWNKDIVMSMYACYGNFILSFTDVDYLRPRLHDTKNA